MLSNAKEALARKADALESTEAGNGGLTVEYVIIICVIVGLGTLLFAFQNTIKDFLGSTQKSLNALLTKLSAGNVSPN